MRTSLSLAAGALVTLGLTAAGLAPAHAAAPWVVTAALDRSYVEYPDSTAVRGTVAGATSGSVTVYVQRTVDDPSDWTYVGKAAVGSTGRFAKRVWPQDSGGHRVKVVRAASGGHTNGQDVESLRVYGWVELTSLPRTLISGQGKPVSGIDYASAHDWDGHGFRSRGGGVLRFDLQRQCTEYSGFTGVDWTSPAGSTGTGRVRALDGSSQIATTPTTHGTRGDDPAYDDLRLRRTVGGVVVNPSSLELRSTVDDPAAAWSFSDAYAYCNLPGAEYYD